MYNPKDAQTTVNTIRTLAIDAVEAANSGHPGAPLGQAPMLEGLFNQHLRLDLTNSNWLNRDRLILSSGHASAGLYAALALYTPGLKPTDLKNFRQWRSLTPGHPEYRHTPFVDATSGPLGQGIAMAVGTALAESHLATMYNTANHTIIDHFTYAICGDGCLMEGVSAEASSLAGTWGLGKLIVLYDSNNITIEGSTDLSFTENVELRYQSYGWQVLKIKDGTDLEAIDHTIATAKANLDQPTLIICETTIGFASPVAGMAKAHGAPLGAVGVAATKAALDWPTNLPAFTVPEPVLSHCQNRKHEWAENVEQYHKVFTAWQLANPDLAEQLDNSLNPAKTLDFAAALFSESLRKDKATRQHSGTCLNLLAHEMPWLFGGSADLAPSNNSEIANEAYYAKNSPHLRNIHFGVREFGMAAIANGIALHGGLLPYVATFFVFSDYCKAAIRMSALMKLRVIYVFTHDSIGVGEDGPTHQPIEQLAMLRSIPNVLTIRPADGIETSAAYLSALSHDGPTAIILSRQTLPTLPTSAEDAMTRGGYKLKSNPNAELILLSSGSEVSLALEVATLLEQDNIQADVVSIPCHEIFRQQPETYKESILPSTKRKRIAIEAGATQSWYEWTGLDGMVFGLDHFGDSAPATELFSNYGLTAPNIVARIKAKYKL